MLIKLAKALVAALVLAGLSVSLASTASARRWHRGWYGRGGYMHARHDPRNTNGW